MGGGFAVSALRGVLVSIGAFLRTRSAFRFFNTSEDALEWVRRESIHRDTVPPNDEVLEQVRRMIARSRVDEKRPM
jgi:hypothetical protein